MTAQGPAKIISVDRRRRKRKAGLPFDELARLIHVVRGVKVMLDQTLHGSTAFRSRG